MKRRGLTWLSVAKDYWWLGGVVVGGILLWGNLPERVKKVEAGQASQQEELSVIRDATKEIQGYLKGQQALNERLAAQQTAPAYSSPLPPQSPAGRHPSSAGEASRDASQAEEVSDDGEVKEMRWTDEQGRSRKMCCNGTDCWSFSPKTQCER